MALGELHTAAVLAGPGMAPRRPGPDERRSAAVRLEGPHIPWSRNIRIDHHPAGSACMSMTSPVASRFEIHASLKHARRWMGAGILCVATLTVLGGFFFAGNLPDYVRRFSPSLIAVLLGFSLVNYALRAWRWDV